MTQSPLETPLPAGPGEHREAVVRAAALALALMLAGTGVVLLAGLPFRGCLAPLIGLVVATGVGAVVLDRIAAFHAYAQFGLGNAVTLARAAVAAVFAALVVEPGLLASPSAAWLALGAAVTVLGLDGIDGWLARRQGLESAFGARFDLEIDALLILVLSGLAFALGKAGSWVLAIGLMRYAFVAAGWLIPALAAPLRPSARRRAVCAVVIAVLALLLAPLLVPPVSAALAGAALVALVASFALDVVWLLGLR